MRRAGGKPRKTDVLERAILLQGTCPGCNLTTQAVARAFSLVVGPKAVPSLPSSLLEASGIGHWRSCTRSHEWLVGIEWRAAIVRCWQCQRPHRPERSPGPCPTCGAAVDVDQIAEDYEQLVPRAATAMGLAALPLEAFQYLDWSHEPDGLVGALLNRPSRPRTNGETATPPPRAQPTLPALREIYGSTIVVEGSVRYSLLGLLGTGGFSQVHLAQSSEGRFVVLKEAWGFREESEKGTRGRVNSYNLTARKLRAESEYLRQFSGNARIPQYIEHFESNGTWYLAMEFIHGPNLREYVHAMAGPNGGLEVAEALRIFKQAADVVGMIHKSQKVHRDVTPRNFLMRAGNPILIDFGTVSADTGPSIEGATGISAGGYHAPEQARGVSSQLCDVFSLGSCLYFLLTGKDPPQAVEDPRADRAMADEMARQGVPPGVVSLVMKSRSWSPTDRFATVDRLLSMVHLFEHPGLRMCTACGAYVERGQRFCPSCGRRHCSACGAAAATQPRCPSCGRLLCQWCDTAIELGGAFCPGCGTRPTARPCPKCHQSVPAGVPFCRLCGASIAA